jgi:hypothetical protein
VQIIIIQKNEIRKKYLTTFKTPLLANFGPISSFSRRRRRWVLRLLVIACFDSLILAITSERSWKMQLNPHPVCLCLHGEINTRDSRRNAQLPKSQQVHEAINTTENDQEVVGPVL